MKGVRVGIVLATLILAAGCGAKQAEYGNDAPRTGDVNTEGAAIIAFPDGFSSVATKCDRGNRIYVIFHSNSPYGSIAVVPADPTCAK